MQGSSGGDGVLRLAVVMATRLCEEAKPLRCIMPYRVIVLCVNFILVKLLASGLSVWSPGGL